MRKLSATLAVLSAGLALAGCHDYMYERTYVPSTPVAVQPVPSSAAYGQPASSASYAQPASAAYYGPTPAAPVPAVASPGSQARYGN